MLTILVYQECINRREPLPSCSVYAILSCSGLNLIIILIFTKPKYTMVMTLSVLTIKSQDPCKPLQCLETHDTPNMV